MAIQAAISLAVAIPALRYLLHPLRRSRKASKYLRAAPLATLREGHPLRVLIEDDRWDAYIHHPTAPVGSVWLLRDRDEEGQSITRCLQTICPHLGCGIDYAADRQAFICPCHASEFDLTGRQRFGPSPRDMDELVHRVTEADDQGRQWIEVQYEEFRTGLSVKRPIV